MFCILRPCLQLVVNAKNIMRDHYCTSGSLRNLSLIQNNLSLNGFCMSKIHSEYLYVFSRSNEYRCKPHYEKKKSLERLITIIIQTQIMIKLLLTMFLLALVTWYYFLLFQWWTSIYIMLRQDYSIQKVTVV